MWPFKSKPPPVPEQPLLWLNDLDYISRWQAYEGILAIGSVGSGKTSTLDELLRGFMNQRAGMCILTASESDYPRIARMAAEEGRLNDLVRFAPGAMNEHGEPRAFDFLNWELSSPGGSVASASQLMQDLVDASTRTDSTKGNDPFWPQASGRQGRMGITLVHRAAECCSVDDLYHFIVSMPRTREELSSPEFHQSFCARVLHAAAAKGPHPDTELAADYVLREFVGLSERTGPSITAQTMNVLEKFMHGSPHELLASGVTNISPDDADEGKIIAIDMPVLKDREPGRFVQMVWKQCFQNHALRRDMSKDCRDLVLVMDEAQLHVLPMRDSMVQAVARKHRLIQVAMTQNLPLLVGALKSKEDAHAWISNLQTKFIFANSDGETNEYFSKMLGQKRELFGSFSPSNKTYDLVGDVFGQEREGGFSMSERMEPEVRPEAFSKLRKGGAEHNYMVDFYCYQAGKKFSNGKTWVKCSYRQRV